MQLFLAIIILVRPTLSQNITCPTSTNLAECICPSDGSAISYSECALRCNGYQSCKQHDMVCRDGADCVVHCEEEEACADAIVHCPSNGRCIIQCYHGLNVCSNIVVNADNTTEYEQNFISPKEPSRSPTPYGYESIVPNFRYNKWTRLSGFNVVRDLTLCAVAYSNETNTMWILGGGKQHSSLISYDIHNNTAVDYGFQALSETALVQAFGYNQFYSQLHHHLYFSQSYDATINRFNVRTASIESITYLNLYWQDLVDTLCLTSATINNNDYLFVTASYELQIYSISNATWIRNDSLSWLIEDRENAACAVAPNGFLYVIAGGVDTVEALNVKALLDSSINSSVSWQLLDDRLIAALYDGRALSYFTDILFMQPYWATISVIDTITNTISVRGLLDFYYSIGPAIIVPFNDGFFRVYVADTQSEITPNSAVFWYMDLLRSQTASPTAYPTWSPTVSYNSYLDAEYGLSHLLPEDIALITTDAVKFSQDLERLMEKSFVTQKLTSLHANEFWVKIEAIKGYPIQDINASLMLEYSQEDILKLQSKIFCSQDVCKHILLKYDPRAFEYFVTIDLRDYFAEAARMNTTTATQSPHYYDLYGSYYSHYYYYYYYTAHYYYYSYYYDNYDWHNISSSETLQFSVLYMSDAVQTAITASTEQPELDQVTLYTQYIIPVYISFGITAVLVLVGFFALSFNKGVCCDWPRIPGFSIVDNGKWTAVMVFALHFYDFSSDIILCLEIWFHPELEHNAMLNAVGIASVVFIIVPYVSNWYYVGKVQSMVVENQFASTWFQNNSKFFTTLVAVSGGCYPSMQLVSSNVFGAAIFQSGLTQYELRQFAKIRIISNIVLESVPQLVCQILYAISVDTISNGLVFAFLASLLSILSTTMSFWMDRGLYHVDAALYHLTLQSNRDDGAISSAPVAKLGMKKHVRSFSDPDDRYHISDDEKKKIKMNKGLLKKIQRDLTQLFSISTKKLQIGSSLETKYGLILRVVHVVHETDLLGMKLKLGMQKEQVLSADAYVQELYASFEEQVNEVFRRHFDLSNNDGFYVLREGIVSANTFATHQNNKSEIELGAMSADEENEGAGCEPVDAVTGMDDKVAQ